MQQLPSVIKLVENNYRETPYDVIKHDYPEYLHEEIKIRQDTWIERETLLIQLSRAVFTAIDEEHDALVAELNRCSHHDDFSVMYAYAQLNIFHTKIKIVYLTKPSVL